MKNERKTITFALFFGNRGFFPGEAIADARREMQEAVEKAGYNWICMEESKTRYGAVETFEEGRQYAAFLKEQEGNYDGLILCLPNFGDESGILTALKEIQVPVLIQAYPDEIGKMDFAHRRDSMCGKFAVCNVLRQADIPYTLTEKYVVHPSSDAFQKEIEKFAGICRVVKGMKHFNLGAIGARTTAFKTVRVDEIALQKKGINVETIDLSNVFAKLEQVSQEKMEEKKEAILAITEFSGFPEKKLETMAKLQVVFEELIEEFDLQAVAIRCWNEFEVKLGIAPCTSLSLLNELGIPAACEVDVTNAVMMRAFSLAMDKPCTLLDYNNNYGKEEDKAILFHCGPVPPSMMKGKGHVEEHLMFKKLFGPESGVGVNKGDMKEGKITWGSLITENGKIVSFVTDGEFTNDEIEKEFFGCGKVVKKDNINDIANYMASNGYKHHVCVTYGECKDVIYEAFNQYLGYEITSL